MKLVKVKFLKSISTGIGSFAPGQVENIPEDHVKPWVDQEVCAIDTTDAKPVGEVRIPKVEPKKEETPEGEDETPSAAKTKKGKKK